MVMQYMPAVLTAAQSDALASQMDAEIRDRGFGPHAIEVPGVAPFVGFVGLHVPSFEASFTPCVEGVWRLAGDAWGFGYATEAASAVVHDGFERVGLSKILAWTVPANVRSRRVMERLGMRHCPGEDFDHPRLPEGHALRRHVLYRLERG
jgi:RimJ/RimL family protein N-acetyltransferase